MDVIIPSYVTALSDDRKVHGSSCKKKGPPRSCASVENVAGLSDSWCNFHLGWYTGASKFLSYLAVQTVTSRAPMVGKLGDGVVNV